MDLDRLNCPQYVNFASKSFLESSKNTDALCSENESASESRLSNESTVEGDLTVTDQENSMVPSDEEFLVFSHLSSSHPQSLQTKKEVTVPKPFHFETDKRVKNKEAIDLSEEKDFISQLRQHDAPQSIVTGVTKVKAFKLTESKIKKAEGSYVPLAEQIKAFQKTPDRFHSTASKKFQPQEHWSPPKLRPRTPKLQAIKRHRVVNALSREEQEAKELEEIKTFEFHAKPVDPRIYQPVVVEKRETKPPTKPEGFDLKTSKRAIVERSTHEESQTSFEFHARPIPKNVLLGPTGLGEKPVVKTTVPISPAFCTRKRLEKRKLKEEQHIEGSAVKKGKIESKPKQLKKNKPKQLKKNKPKPKFVRPRPTRVEPFSFDHADKMRYALKEKKILEEIEKENKAFIFEAQPLPSPSISALPKVDKKPVTQPQPFNFVLDSRSFSHEVSSKEESVSFKAQPATVLKKQPFIPEKPQNHSIAIKEFELNTDRRASERLKLMQQKEAEEKEKEQMLLARKALEEERERQEILRLRQELVHKANPIRQYKTLEIKHSSKELTEPISPQFETDKRLRERNRE